MSIEATPEKKTTKRSTSRSTTSRRRTVPTVDIIEDDFGVKKIVDEEVNEILQSLAEIQRKLAPLKKLEEEAKTQLREKLGRHYGTYETPFGKLTYTLSSQINAEAIVEKYPESKYPEFYVSVLDMDQVKNKLSPEAYEEFKRPQKTARISFKETPAK